MSWHETLVSKVDDLSAKLATVSMEVETVYQFFNLELKRMETKIDESSAKIGGNDVASMRSDLELVSHGDQSDISRQLNSMSDRLDAHQDLFVTTERLTHIVTSVHERFCKIENVVHDRLCQIEDSVARVDKELQKIEGLEKSAK